MINPRRCWLRVFRICWLELGCFLHQCVLIPSCRMFYWIILNYDILRKVWMLLFCSCSVLKHIFGWSVMGLIGHTFFINHEKAFLIFIFCKILCFRRKLYLAIHCLMKMNLCPKYLLNRLGHLINLLVALIYALFLL